MNTVIKTFLCCIILILSGCSKNHDGNILDTVPADAKAVVTADLDAIVKNAGCKVVNGVVTLSPDLQGLVEKMNNHQQLYVKRIIAIASMVNISHIVFYLDNAGSPVLTFELTRPELFNVTLSASAKSYDTEGDYTVYKMKEGGIVATNGTQGWIADDIDTVIRNVNNAQQMPLSTNTAAYEYVNYASTVTCALSISDKIVKDKSGNIYKHICGVLNLTDNLIEGEFAMIDQEGNNFDATPYIEPIDANIAKLIPDNSQLVIASGKPADMSQILSNATKYADCDMTTAQIINLLGQAINGSMAVAASPAADSQYLFTSPETAWNASAAVQLDSESMEQILSLASLAALSGGVDIYEDDVTGQQCLDYKSGRIFYGSFDDYFAMSTTPIDETNTGAYAEQLNGSLFTVIANVPYNSPIVKALNIPYGFTVTANVLTDRTNVAIRINGSNSSILKSAIEMTKSVLAHKNFDFEKQFEHLNDEEIDYDTYD